MTRARRGGGRRCGNGVEFRVHRSAGSPSGQNRSVEDGGAGQGVGASTQERGERTLALDGIFRLESNHLSVDADLPDEYLSGEFADDIASRKAFQQSHSVHEFHPFGVLDSGWPRLVGSC